MSASSDLLSAGAQASAGPVDNVSDGMADLRLHVREAIAEATDLIKQGTAPPPYFFAFEPSGGDQEQADLFAAMLGASGLARIYAGMNLVRSGPDHTTGGGGGGSGKGDKTNPRRHYSLKNPGEYVAAFNEKTEATLDAFLHGPLQSLYGQREGGSNTTLDLHITRPELHANALAAIFGGLQQVDATHQEELEKVLTRFTAALKPFKLPTPAHGCHGGKEGGDGPQPDLKFAVVVNYIKSVDITGGSGGIFVNEPHTRIVVFSVNPQQWATALQKPPPPHHGSPSSSATEERPVVSGTAGHPEAADGAAHDVLGGVVDATSVADVAAGSAGGDGAPGDADAAGKSIVNALPGWFRGKPKPKPDERIKFTLQTTVFERRFDKAMYDANKARFETIFKNMASEDEKLAALAERGGLHALGLGTCKIYQAREA